jgi:hypothetical protein
MYEVGVIWSNCFGSNFLWTAFNHHVKPIIHSVGGDYDFIQLLSYSKRCFGG